jgi:NAD(P)H-dependent flavin oxidoreductase YrpB (nitropropane dioxygenase family)
LVEPLADLREAPVHVLAQRLERNLKLGIHGVILLPSTAGGILGAARRACGDPGATRMPASAAAVSP